MMEKAIADIVEFLQKERSCDYSGHYTSMLSRRIMTRVEATKMSDVASYFTFLTSDPDEPGHLIDALTINVSMFFRNAITFELIARQVIPSLFYTKLARENREFRIWSAGCSTGEEPYSMAILLNEFLRKETIDFNKAIFATDLEKKNLQQARKAVYPASSMEEVKLGILKKYFKPDAESYRLLPGIRNSVNFSVYDLLDAGNFAPPESVFGDFDIILCRNVLIYYQPGYQAKIFYKLHRSLSPGGYLVLGETESLPEAYAGKFRELHRIARIYQKL